MKQNLGDLIEILNQDQNIEIQSLSDKNNFNSGQKIEKKEFIKIVNFEILKKQTLEVIQDLNWDEKFEWVFQKKLKGNRLYYKEKYEEAQDIYLQSLLGLELKTGNEVKDKKVIQELQIPILLNLVQCKMKMKQYQNAIQLIDQVLIINPYEIKALYLKGNCYLELKRYDDSKLQYNLALNLAKQTKNQQKINSILNQFQVLKQKRSKESQVYQQMFNGKKIIYDNNQQEFHKNDNQNNSSILYYDDQLEEIQQSQGLIAKYFYKYVIRPLKNLFYI